MKINQMFKSLKNLIAKDEVKIPSPAVVYTRNLPKIDDDYFSPTKKCDFRILVDGTIAIKTNNLNMLSSNMVFYRVGKDPQLMDAVEWNQLEKYEMS